MIIVPEYSQLQTFIKYDKFTFKNDLEKIKAFFCELGFNQGLMNNWIKEIDWKVEDNGFVYTGCNLDTTWGECLNSYIKETNTEYYNPRQDISEKHKVTVVKIEYTNGIECKSGYYDYGLITQIFDKKTDELLTSVGYYTDNK